MPPGVSQHCLAIGTESWIRRVDQVLLGGELYLPLWKEQHSIIGLAAAWMARRTVAKNAKGNIVIWLGLLEDRRTDWQGQACTQNSFIIPGRMAALRSLGSTRWRNYIIYWALVNTCHIIPRKRVKPLQTFFPPWSLCHSLMASFTFASASAAVTCCPNASTNVPSGSMKYMKMEWSTR